MSGPKLLCVAGCGAEVGAFFPLCGRCALAAKLAGRLVVDNGKACSTPQFRRLLADLGVTLVQETPAKAINPRLNSRETTGVVPAHGCGSKIAPGPFKSVGRSGGAK